MALRLRNVSATESPRFIKLLETDYRGGKALNIKEVIDDVFNVAVERGLNDGEFSLLIHLFCKGSLRMKDRLKLLENLAPERKVPSNAFRQFMVWFVTNLVKEGDGLSVSAASRILQWIIGLLEHSLVDSQEIYNFYYDLYMMLEYPSLVPFVSKLLCKLSKPDDVTGQTVRTLNVQVSLNPNKYLLAVLNVFNGYKPHLMLGDVKKVDVLKVLGSVNQTMDSVMRVRVINTRAPQMKTKALGIREVPTKNFSYFEEELNKISSLIPLPTYNFEGLEKFGACYPNSIEEACRKFSQVAMPHNIMSLLHNDTGFFVIMFQGIEVQMRFENVLLQTLQNAFIYQELKTTEEDAEFLLKRLFCLQTFMQQGIPCVSVFLSGYLLVWEGVDHRYNILKLIEWVTFHSFRELACNILRPLHVLFVTNNVSMRREIIQTLINLIRNMFVAARRVQQGIPFPFLKRGPKWTKEPVAMLDSLIRWTQNLITLALSMDKDDSTILMVSLKFYEMVNNFEAASDLRMFTVVSQGVVLQSLLGQNPNTIIRICRLLLRYHREFLPQLRRSQPGFYEQCEHKVGLTSNYAQRIIYFLQNGQVVSPTKENGIIVRDSPSESLAAGEDSFSLTVHTCFVATYVTYESRKNFLDLSKRAEVNTCVELAAGHLREVTDFINYFSP